MLRIHLLAVAVIAALGCNRAEPLPSPREPTPDSAGNDVTQQAATTVADAPLPASPAAPNQSPFRDMAARYVHSDGQGGWQKDERIATDLEKLTPSQVAQLWPLLDDSDVDVRRGAAVFLLSQFDSHQADEVAAFVKLLGDSDGMVRARGLDAVRQFERSDQLSALTYLTSLLDAAHETRPDNRAAAARLCGSLRKDATIALPSLHKTVTVDPDAKTRGAALTALTQIADPVEAISSLTASLADRDASVRLVAAARLRQMGPAAASSAKELAAALADDSPDVAEAAAEALIRIGPAAVEPLAGTLPSLSASGRRLALACLIKLGPAAKSAVPAIAKCTQDPDNQTRQLAETALKRLNSP